MQQATPRLNDYGDLIIEIDKLIRADRSSLTYPAPPISHSCNPQTDCYNQVTPASATVTNSVIQHLSARRPTPTLWDTLPPCQPTFANHIPESPSSRGQDMRQVRLFKTRFCSYGLECPYLAKGKCLYAHSKDEIRCRPPPPPVGQKSIARRTSCGSMSPHSTCSFPDQSPAGSNESVWSLPTSPNHGVWGSAVGCSQLPEPKMPSLFDCLPPPPKGSLPYSQSRSTVASSSSFLSPY
jgi:hypothetical protein